MLPKKSGDLTTFTNLTDAQLATGKPIPQSTTRAWRDNPKAIAEGDPTAPRISPKAIASPYFRATRTSNFNISGTGTTRVPFNTEVYDPDSLYDNTTNYRFQPTTPGLYLVGVNVRTSNVGAVGSFFAVARKNGTDIATAGEYQAANNQMLNPTVQTIVQLDGVNDYLEGACYQTGSGGTYDVQGEFWAVCLCET